MNKTSIGFVVAGLLIAALGVGLLFQQKQNIQLARKISELENQFRAQTETNVARTVFLESIHTELTQMSEAQAQLRSEHETIADVVAADSAARKAPQAGMLQRTNSASILARLPYLTAEAYRLAATGVGPIQSLVPPVKPVPWLTYQQVLRLSHVQQTQYFLDLENYQRWVSGRNERISINAQFLLENKLRELGADSQTIESVRLANTRRDEANTRRAASDAQQSAASAQEDIASAIRSQAAAQETTAQEIRMQRLTEPIPFGPTKVKIVP